MTQCPTLSNPAGALEPRCWNPPLGSAARSSFPFLRPATPKALTLESLPGRGAAGPAGQGLPASLAGIAEDWERTDPLIERIGWRQWGNAKDSGRQKRLSNTPPNKEQETKKHHFLKNVEPHAHQ